jgi:Inner membrane component of T3SS, cytoplasmic domain
MAKLVVNSGASRGREYELKPGVNSLGRSYSCDFRLDDVSVSGSHAQIIVDAFSVTVKDLHSTNGTFINRSQIREGFLQPGQIVSLGGVEMLFVADGTEQVAASSAIARTVALPQVGGIKIARPSAAGGAPAPAPGAMAPSPAGSGGFRLPMNYPAPMMPTPNLTTSPTPLSPPGQQAQPAAMPQVSVEARTWRNVEAVRPEMVGALRCFGFGTGAAVLSAALWIGGTAATGASVAPYGTALTGLLCGLAMRKASRNRPAGAFGLLALGFSLLGMFAGESGQVFLLQTVNFQNFNLAGLVAGLALASIFGGVGGTEKAPSRTQFA